MTLPINKNIREFRKQKGFTQEELAAQLGVTSQAVSRWESSAGLPDISLVVPIAGILGVTTDALFGVQEFSQDEHDIRRVRQYMDAHYADDANPEILLAACNYLKQETIKHPICYEILCMYLEKTTALSRYVDLNGFLKEQPETWKQLEKDALQKGISIIRYSNDKELVEKAHFAIAWIYIHAREYEQARTHIYALPSVVSNRLQESILAQLAQFEHGFAAQKKVVRSNLQNFTRAICKEIVYAMEDYMYCASVEEAETFFQWGLSVMYTLGTREDLRPYTMGFVRRCHIFMTGSYLRHKQPKKAAAHFQKMCEDMESFQKYCQNILFGKDAAEFFIPKVIEKLEIYRDDFVKNEIQRLLARLRKLCNAEMFEAFMAFINEK